MLVLLLTEAECVQVLLLLGKKKGVLSEMGGGRKDFSERKSDRAVNLRTRVCHVSRLSLPP